ncbi:MAG: hydantoinase [Rhodospirillaceae bacterium]|nr:hydantoinase [Rhodospirillaceae bacterium]
MGYRVGVDIGGTFTDFCVFDEDSGSLTTLKVLSRPDEPGAEIKSGLAKMEHDYGLQSSHIVYFTHGTTVGVNTIIQRKGVNLCLFTTENFEDVLEVARLKMPDPYDLYSARATPLVTRDKVFGIRERILSNGEVDLPLAEVSVKNAIKGVQKVGGEAIVVSLLHAYRNPEHERYVAQIIKSEAPEINVILASDIWPVIREYERTITATVAGYVQPQVSYYLTSLQRVLSEAAVESQPMITKSNGGVMTAEHGKTDCAQMLLSGTASGVMGAASVAMQIGVPMSMSLDIGGTSADVSIIISGKPQFGTGELIGEFPVFIPSVSVSSIGEGGGSIAWLDEQGVLKVGPESAGSNPGPACYGKGGTRPTITDALVVLGYLGRSQLGYNAVELDVDLAFKSLSSLSKGLSLEVAEVAEAIVQIAISGMYLEISKLVARQGVDPRELSMIAFGGAGPMLACWIADELGMKNIIVPRVPGVLSAYGGLIADIKNDFIRTVYLDLNPSCIDELKDGFGALAREAMNWIREDQGFDGDVAMMPSAEMRYRGQSYEIDTPLEAVWIENGDIGSIVKAFHELHEKIFDHADNEAEVQVINLRMVISGQPAKPAVRKLSEASSAIVAREFVQVYGQGEVRSAGVYQRIDMAPGHCIEGPAIIIQDDCTTCVLENYTVSVDDFGNLLVFRTDIK